jgi:hypothetical protein
MVIASAIISGATGLFGYLKQSPLPLPDPEPAPPVQP